MDLAAGAKRIWVLMEHTTKDGESRARAPLHLSADRAGVVKRVYTDLAVLDVTERRLRRARHGARPDASRSCRT